MQYIARISLGILSLWMALTGVAAAETYPVSSLDLGAVQQGWGNARANRSVENNPLSIGGQKFEHGFGTHAGSILRIAMNGQGKRFTAKVGVDDEVSAGQGSVTFEVIGDGKTLWKSEVLRSGDAAKPVDVDLSGVKLLLLKVGNGGDHISYDHADWAEAQIVMAEGKPETVSPPVEAAVILTPKPSPKPRINGAKIFGVRPGSSFLFTIPATGERPMTFSAENLPDGLEVNPQTGRITGVLEKIGEYRVTLRAKNALGAAERAFKIVCGEQIALTSPMGWNSWNCWGPNVNAEKVLASARAMVEHDLINHGWTYINIDDAWQSRRGGKYNAIQPNEKFPDMQGLCDEIHAMGLKVGIYSTPWVTSYAGYVGGSANNPEGAWPPEGSGEGRRRETRVHGKYVFAENDAKQWAAWGMDYLKYDWNPIEPAETRVMADALRASGRDIVYSLSNSTPFRNIAELSKIANCWRTSGDITDNWSSMSSKGFGIDRWEPYAGPGHWNDPDMLVVGYVDVGKGRNLHPTRLSPNEQYTHISIWSLLSAPLLLGCDMARLDDFTLNLLTNDEVLEVHQDPLGNQAMTVFSKDNVNVYAKDMEDGSKAVGLFNLGEEMVSVTARWSDLKLSGQCVVRDLWRQKDLGAFDGQFQAEVPRHGVVLVKIRRQ